MALQQQCFVFCVLRRGLGEAYRPGVSLQAWQGGGWAVSWVLILELGRSCNRWLAIITRGGRWWLLICVPGVLFFLRLGVEEEL